MATVGFIGLGNMGGPMMRNLAKAGHTVCAFDVMDAARQAAAGAGAAVAATAAEATRDVDVVVTMLPAGEHVRAVYLGDGGILDVARKGTLFIDSSTIDVATARDVAAAAVAMGHMMVDAPVSGGVGGAEAGTLTFMVGGPDAAFEQARPLLENMGKTIVHAGGPGNGQAAKICNNMLLGISMIGTCEAFALAEKLGLDAQKLFDISSKASGQNWSMTSYCPVPGPVPTSPANRDYKAGFTAAMMLKDLKLAMEAAARSGAAVPLGAEAGQLYSMFVGAGNGALDFSGIIRMVRGG
jgi:3-hydroxyisobutyrate dehydrogenase